MRTIRLMVATVLTLLSAGVLVAASTIVTIDEAKAKQPGVPFDHAKHANNIANDACDVCHHTQKGLTQDSTGEVKTCATCHLDPRDSKIPSSREMSPNRNPFHIRCIGCHKERKSGPTTCASCHKN